MADPEGDDTDEAGVQDFMVLPSEEDDFVGAVRQGFVTRHLTIVSRQVPNQAELPAMLEAAHPPSDQLDLSPALGSLRTLGVCLQI